MVKAPNNLPTLVKCVTELPGGLHLDRAKFRQNRLKFSVIKIIDYVFLTSHDS